MIKACWLATCLAGYPRGRFPGRRWSARARAAAPPRSAAIPSLVRSAISRRGVHPQLIVLAAARATGKLGADIARIGGVDLETVLGDLADLVREAGRAHAEDLPVAGSA